MDKESLMILTESNLIDLANQKGCLKHVLEELNRRRLGLVYGEIGGVDPMAHAKSIESIMSKLGKGVRSRDAGINRK